jgi:uncharacterized protein (TIGR02246 family)
MKMCKLPVFAGLFALALSGFALVPGARAADDETSGVREQCKEFVTAFNRHDGKAMASVFAEDADMVTPAGQLVKGRAAIEQAIVADHTKGPLREASLEVKDEPVRFVTPDVAVSDATVLVKGAYGPDGTKAGPMTLLVTNVWKKTDGRWWLFASRQHVQAAATPKG